MLIETKTPTGTKMFHYTDETGRRKALIETLRSQNTSAPAERTVINRFPNAYVEAYQMDDILVAQLPDHIRKEINDKKQTLMQAVSTWKTLNRKYTLRDKLLALPLEDAANHVTVLGTDASNMTLFTVDYIIDSLADDFKYQSNDGYTHQELYTIHDTTNF